MQRKFQSQRAKPQQSSRREFLNKAATRPQAPANGRSCEASSKLPLRHIDLNHRILLAEGDISGSRCQ